MDFFFLPGFQNVLEEENREIYMYNFYALFCITLFYFISYIISSVIMFHFGDRPNVFKLL